jgi:hypothetical protein
VKLQRRIARSGTDEWYKAREYGVSATTVAKAASGPGGYDAELKKALHPEEHLVEDNAYMRFGRDWEQWIVQSIPAEYGIEHNDWLIRAEEEERHLATPDGLNEDWSVIAEVKTTGKDWDKGLERETIPSDIPIQYRRQVQWQMYVTGATSCVFAWLLRMESDSGEFVPAWIEPKIMIIERDEDMIRELILVAKRFATDYNHYKEAEQLFRPTHY